MPARSPSKRATSRHTKEVDAWFAKYANPKKDVVLRIREIALDADPRIEETSSGRRRRSRRRLEGTGATSRVMKIATVGEANAPKRDIERLVRAWCDWRDADSEES